jgi:hypothetical protein
MPKPFTERRSDAKRNDYARLNRLARRTYHRLRPRKITPTFADTGPLTQKHERTRH